MFGSEPSSSSRRRAAAKCSREEPAFLAASIRSIHSVEVAFRRVQIGRYHVKAVVVGCWVVVQNRLRGWLPGEYIPIKCQSLKITISFAP